ncbi:MAG: phosphoglycerate dehydrogenase [Immundisolibacter sp.]|uniref:phosphoglycerate dehydrogenase n=1 Tax=Immundisolibacter sp. TaxID=1934948 RepID=UPI003D0D2415
MYRILTLNNISKVGLSRLPADRYQTGKDLADPDAILLRSADLHSMAVPASLQAVGRAGAGVNNIPVAALSARGIPVFNTPGANANAVKELVIAGLLLAARNICQAWSYTQALTGDHETVEHAVEAGKKQFAGFELPGRTLGVVGLGAIGRQVANAALALGMKVIGFDPGITVEGAWQLSAQVERATSVEAVFSRADFITFHVPLNDHTRGLANADTLRLARPGLTVLNFARAGIVDTDAVAAALETGQVHYYVSDFPKPGLIGHPRVIALPHLGASTTEAEENCAVMVADQVRDYLENGNITNAVNFPWVVMPRAEEGVRLAVANANVPNMVGQITTALADAGLNIIDMINKSKGELAYTLVDVDRPVPAEVLGKIRAIAGVLSVRCP